MNLPAPHPDAGLGVGRAHPTDRPAAPATFGDRPSPELGARWRSLLDALDEIVLVCDAAGAVVLANRVARALWPALDTTGPVAVVDVVPELAGGNGTEVTTERDGHRLAWRAHELDGGHLAWHAAAPVAAPVGAPSTGGALDPLTELSLLVGGPLTPEHVAEAVARLAAPALAECCLVVLPAPRGRYDWWRHAEDGPPEHGRVGQESVRAVPGLVEVLSDPGSDAGLRTADCPAESWLPPTGFGPVREVLLVPLAGPAHSPGALILLNPAGGEPGLVTEFVRRAGATLGTAIRFREQAAVSESLQSSLLPLPLPTVAGVRFAAAYRPARSGLRVGGDFYDVHPGGDGSAVFALGDACGHGPEAASLAGHVRSCLGALRLVEEAPDRLLSLLNQAIRTTSGSRFTTAVLGSLTVGADRHVRLALGCAGHPAPLVLRSDGRVDEVLITGGLLGVFPDVQFDRAEVTLAPGEVCLLYSDGVTEARRGDDSGEQFGTERLRAVAHDYTSAPADELVDAIHTELDRWLAGRNHDDITLLAIQAAPELG